MEPFSQIIVPGVLALNKALNPRGKGFQNVPLGWNGRNPVSEGNMGTQGQDMGNLLTQLLSYFAQQDMQTQDKDEYLKAILGGQKSVPMSFDMGQYGTTAPIQFPGQSWGGK
jgi:hypothetical protein